jgi:hypothetical protein
MAAMVAGGMIPILTRSVIHTANKALMFIDFIDMAMKCPHRPITEGADNEPYHEKPFKHFSSIHI